MSDERQRFMPTPEDRESGEPLAYKEAVLLKNPTNPDFNGEVKTKIKHTNYPIFSQSVENATRVEKRGMILIHVCVLRWTTSTCTRATTRTAGSTGGSATIRLVFG